MQIQDIQSAKRSRKRRIGRGGKRGTFSGRGTKGQKARAGRRIRPQVRDVIKKLPKRRGHGTHGNTLRSFRTRARVVNIAALEIHFAAGDMVNPATIVEKGIIRRSRGVAPAVKILGGGHITKSVTVSGCEVSVSARAAIEKAGGTVSS